jgi:hypothetical protein
MVSQGAFERPPVSQDLSEDETGPTEKTLTSVGNRGSDKKTVHLALPRG